MYSVDFEFANKRLSDFGCMIGYINGGGGTFEVNPGCDITFSTVKNNHSSIHSKTSSSYESVYTTTFEIIKKNCSGEMENSYFSMYEVRQLIKWLNRRTYQKFKPFYSDIEDSDIFYFGSFNVTETMLNGRIIGLTLVFTATTPFAFGSQINSTYRLNNYGTVSIYGDSDEYGVIYPKVEIKCLSSGTLSITNQTTGKILTINNCTSGEIIIVDSEHEIIMSNNEWHNQTIANDFNYEYFMIQMNEDWEENIYSSTIPCELKISYFPVRKVGVM